MSSGRYNAVSNDLEKRPLGKGNPQAREFLNVVVECLSTEKRFCSDDFEVKETTREIQ
ncbi:MAG: hypothetical protein VX607_04470 [Planctomycetota bacterium]|jgi:hypothetical protein|nr:hypothetical protein [Planctomycetota bacterium]MEC7598683.1 hypothetical protein [Planctomycetota bacterium]MEC7716422.1 hypothetical protein [Planctomycetota bacterium]MEC8411491.1 hypothetical protein [Planctomycetota bacterium]MEC8591416.1 hypothetical protein [Planctomycetota bacterium]